MPSTKSIAPGPHADRYQSQPGPRSRWTERHKGIRCQIDVQPRALARLFQTVMPLPLALSIQHFPDGGRSKNRGGAISRSMCPSTLVPELCRSALGPAPGAGASVPVCTMPRSMRSFKCGGSARSANAEQRGDRTIFISTARLPAAGGAIFGDAGLIFRRDQVRGTA